MFFSVGLYNLAKGSTPFWRVFTGIPPRASVETCRFAYAKGRPATVWGECLAMTTICTPLVMQFVTHFRNTKKAKKEEKGK